MTYLDRLSETMKVAMNNADPHFTVIENIQYDWYLRITPEFKIAQKRRPNWFYRMMMGAVFGWRWEAK